MALNRLAEASAITAMRFVTCNRPQESQALSENPSTTQKAVVRITALSSADTVKRFSIIGPLKIPPIWAKKGKYLDSIPAGTTADPRSTDLLRNVERPRPVPSPEPRSPPRVKARDPLARNDELWSPPPTEKPRQPP